MPARAERGGAPAGARPRAPLRSLLLAAGCLAAPAPAEAARRAAPARAARALRVRLRSRPLRARHARAEALVQLSSLRAPGRPGPAPRALVGSVFVGTPPQELSVAFDTGSGNLLLPGKACASAACLAHRAYDAAASASAGPAGAEATGAEAGAGAGAAEGAAAVRLPLGAGEASGRPLRDVVCLGPGGELCARCGLVEAAELSEDPFGLLPYDGVLGLGLPGASLAPPFNFFGSLARTGALEGSRFAVWLASGADAGAEGEEGEEGGEITFGAVSPERLAVPEILWQPLAGAGGGLWQVALSDVAVGPARLRLCGGGCRAALDTGTGVIAGPAALISAVLAALNIDPACGNYRDLPALGFALAGATLHLDPSDYVERSAAGCSPRLLALDTPAAAGPPVVLLGAPFLERYYSVYDAGSLRVGLGLARHAPLPGANETAAQAAARLVVRGGAAR